MIPIAHAEQANLNAVGSAAGFSQTDLLTIVGNIINIFLGLLGVIFLLLTIYAGYLWMTSEGNEELVEKAKNILKSAVIGLIICLAAYSITTFIINALLDATGNGSTVSESTSSIEAFSDSLGSGGIQDHYPGRNATDIPRNTRILVTFKNSIYLPSLIDGYDVGQNAGDTSDDTAPSPANVNTDNFTLSCVDEGGTTTEYASGEITVSFTDDLKNFVFDPPVLGSAVTTSDCTVTLSDSILTYNGADALSETYEWTFTVSTELDLTPPTVESVVPVDGATGYGRNITEQITFSEGVDPTTATGTYDATDGGFTKIKTLSDSDEDGTFSPVAGSYETSSSYTIVEFTPSDACGTNSCGTIVYCLPGPDAAESAVGTEEEVQLAILAAEVGDDAPQASSPYTGVVDLAGNALDGNDDGTAGDDYSEQFSVTDDIVLDAPKIASVTPEVLGEDVALDQDVVIVWDSLMKSSTMTNAVISILANPDHDMWYLSQVSSLDENGEAVSTTGLDPDHSELTIPHGTFLESTDTSSQLYAPILPDDIESLYQNCFYPADGPGATSGTSCATSSAYPNCCNGTASSKGFDDGNFKCQL